EAFGVFDKLFIAAIGPREVCLQTIRDVLNTAAKGRDVEHVDYCPMNVGDWYLRVMPPARLGAEYLVGAQMLQHELEALPCLALLADGLTGDDDNVLEDL